MVSVEAILTLAVLLGPALGWLTAVAVGRRLSIPPRSPVLFGAVISLAASSAIVTLQALSLWEQPAPLVLLSWLDAPDLFPARLAVTAGCDGLAAVVVPASSLLFVLAAWTSQNGGREERASAFAAGRLPLLQLSTNLVLLAADLFSLLAAWQLVSLAAWGMRTSHRRRSSESTVRFLVERGGDLLVMIGAILAWSLLGTFDLWALLDDTGTTLSLAPFLSETPTEAEVREVAALLAVLSLCLSMAAAVRCGVFPFFVDPVEAETADREAASILSMVRTAALLPVGLALAARLSPLYVLAATAGTVVAGLGAMTAVLAGWAAVVQTDRDRILHFSAASVAGIAFTGLGAAGPAALPGVLVLLVTLMAALFALRLASPAAGVVLASGVWGQAQILSLLPAGTGGPLAPALFAGCLAGVVLTAAALARFWLLPPRATAAPNADAAPRIAATAAAVLLGPLLVGLVPLPFIDRADGLGGLRALFGDPATALLVILGTLVGAVAARLIHAGRLGSNPRFAAVAAPFLRLGRQTFYLAECGHLFARRPLLAAAHSVGWLDRRLLDGLLHGLPRRVVQWASQAAAPLQNDSPQFYVLALLLATASLLAAVVWL